MRVFSPTLSLLILFVGGCRGAEPLARDPALAKREVIALVPNGTPVQTAVESMERKGFKCRVQGHTNSDQKTYLYCVTAESGLLLVVRRGWLVRFEIKDENVYEPYVDVSLTGL